MKMPADLKAALSGEMTPKFLATLGPSGEPNCVPVISITPEEDEHLVFGEFMLNKTRQNLLACDKVGVAVITASLEMWSLKGTFLGFEEQGERVEFINNLGMLRYNAYTSIRAAGVIRVEEVAPKRRLGRLRVLCDYIRVSALARLLGSKAREDGGMPRQVMEKFARLSAVRAVAYQDSDGFPQAFATMTCLAAGPRRLVFSDSAYAARAEGMMAGARVAVSVLTTDPIAYQVKGVYRGQRLGVGVLDIEACYSASPPLVGERLGQ